METDRPRPGKWFLWGPSSAETDMDVNSVSTPLVPPKDERDETLALVGLALGVELTFDDDRMRPL